MARIAKPMIQKEEALAFATKKKPAAEYTARVFHAPDGFKRLAINIPEEMHKALKQAALDRGCTSTDIVTKLLEDELDIKW